VRPVRSKLHAAEDEREKKGCLPIEQRIDQSFSFHPKVLSNILQN